MAPTPPVFSTLPALAVSAAFGAGVSIPPAAAPHRAVYQPPALRYSAGRAAYPVPLTRQARRDVARRALRARTGTAHGGRKAARATLRAAMAGRAARAALNACTTPQAVLAWARDVDLLAYAPRANVRRVEVQGASASGVVPAVPATA